MSKTRGDTAHQAHQGAHLVNLGDPFTSQPHPEPVSPKRTATRIHQNKAAVSSLVQRAVRWRELQQPATMPPSARPKCCVEALLHPKARLRPLRCSFAVESRGRRERDFLERSRSPVTSKLAKKTGEHPDGTVRRCFCLGSFSFRLTQTRQVWVGAAPPGPPPRRHRCPGCLSRSPPAARTEVSGAPWLSLTPGLSAS